MKALSGRPPLLIALCTYWLFSPAVIFSQAAKEAPPRTEVESANSGWFSKIFQINEKPVRPLS
ncbi:MAG TPA: hypothetical protein VE398_15720, partial [Acidobacteriota bacterium]|nr:hypothetical protein [Acidobacteriota bacterium]